MKPAAHSISSPAWIDLVQQKVETLRFGLVQIVVHDGKVVQIDRTEKVRLELQTSALNALPTALEI